MDFGTPYDRCKIEFQEAATDCAEQLGETLSFMCHVDALDDLCEVTKAVDILCLLPSLIKQNVFKPIEAGWAPMEMSSVNPWMLLIQIIYYRAGQNLGNHKGIF